MNSKNIILIVSSALGAILSGILIEHHVSPGTNSEFLQAICDVGGKSGCDAVNQSGASSFLGMPLAFWGFLYYTLILAYSLFYMKFSQVSLVRLIFWLTFVAIVVDFTLLLYSLMIVETVCNLCILTYLCTLGVLFGAVMILKKKGESIFKFNFDFSWLRGHAIAPAMLIFSFIVVIFLGSFIYLYAKSSSDGGDSSQGYDALLEKAWESFQRQYEATSQREIPIEHSPYKGASDPVITIVEFADFLCPHCKIASLQLKKMVEKYRNSIRIVFKHYPLDQTCNKNISRKFHEGACKIAYLGHCATLQRMSAFWKVHDRVFDKHEQWRNQGKASEQDFNKIVSSAGLNAASAASCTKREQTKQAIVRDIELGDEIGVTGTPALFINGRRVPQLPNDYLFDKLLTYEVQKQLGNEKN